MMSQDSMILYTMAGETQAIAPHYCEGNNVVIPTSRLVGMIF